MHYSRVVTILLKMGLHFLPIFLIRLDFNHSVFWFFVTLFLWYLVFSFSVLCFKFNFVSKDLIIFV